MNESKLKYLVVWIGNTYLIMCPNILLMLILINVNFKMCLLIIIYNDYYIYGTWKYW